MHTERNERLEVIQTWFNSESGLEAGVSQLRHVGLVSIVRRMETHRATLGGKGFLWFALGVQSDQP